MATNPRGLLLAINPYIARLQNGAVVGEIGPLNLTTLTITQPDPEVVNIISTGRDDYGQAKESYSRPQPAELTMAMNMFTPDVVSMAMLGTPAAYTQAAATDTAGTVRAYHDLWVGLGVNNLTDFAVTGKTEGTDYEVDLEAGLFRALSDGTIANDSDVAYTYSAPARDGYVVDAGTDPLIQVQIRGEGTNLYTSEQITIEVWQANISPSGGLAFISNDPVSLEFTGTLIKPPGRPGTYRLRVHRAVA